jgi:hypothetical protein
MADSKPGRFIVVLGSCLVLLLSPFSQAGNSAGECRAYYLRPSHSETIVSILKGKGSPETVEIKIHGKKLSKAALANFRLELEAHFARSGQTEYSIRDFGSFQVSPDGVVRQERNGVEEIVRRANPRDLELLQYSGADTKPMEFGQIGLFNSSGELLSTSAVYTSFHRSKIGGDEIYNGIVEAFSKKGLNKSEVAYMELLHTHPVYELNSAGEPIEFSLSPADISSNEYNQKQYPRLKLFITAVLPNGYVYSSFGQKTTTPEDLRFLETIRK